MILINDVILCCRICMDSFHSSSITFLAIQAPQIGVLKPYHGTVESLPLYVGFYLLVVQFSNWLTCCKLMIYTDMNSSLVAFL